MLRALSVVGTIAAAGRIAVCAAATAVGVPEAIVTQHLIAQAAAGGRDPAPPFPAAHVWYVALPVGRRREGWKCANESGARYALQVIALHRRFRDCFGPPPPKAAREPSPARPASAERLRDEAETKLDSEVAKGFRRDALVARLRFRLAAARMAALRYRREVVRLRPYGAEARRVAEGAAR